jgi:hypothetical protein
MHSVELLAEVPSTPSVDPVEPNYSIRLKVESGAHLCNQAASRNSHSATPEKL